MEPFKIKTYTKAKTIYRYIKNEEGIINTLGMRNNRPTFLLGPIEDYREQKDERGDHHENEIISQHPQTKKLLSSSKNVNPILISSCSAVFSEEIFPDDLMAIESTVGDVHKILAIFLFYLENGKIKHILLDNENYNVKDIKITNAFRAPPIIHGEVIYYQGDISNLEELLHCFYKRAEKYEKEKEYRFAIMFNCGSIIIIKKNDGEKDGDKKNKIIFYLQNISYIKKIHLRTANFESKGLIKLLAEIKAHCAEKKIEIVEHKQQQVC